jgi:uncharacterized membrane protein
MNKNRLENFSDGVFAIAVTLLILNLHIPESKDLDNPQLNHAIYRLVPHAITFAFTFLVIGVFWVAHHRIFSFVKVLNNTLLWLNIVYLMFIALMPLPAAILSEHPFLPSAILLYTITLLIIALLHFVLMEYTLRNKHLKHEALTREVYLSAKRNAIVGPVCYIMAAATSFISGYISFTFILAAIVYYIFFLGHSKEEEKIVIAAKKEAEA